MRHTSIHGGVETGAELRCIHPGRTHPRGMTPVEEELRGRSQSGRERQRLFSPKDCIMPACPSWKWPSKGGHGASQSWRTPSSTGRGHLPIAGRHQVLYAGMGMGWGRLWCALPHVMAMATGVVFSRRPAIGSPSAD